jgi:hypothetical protein
MRRPFTFRARPRAPAPVPLQPHHRALALLVLALALLPWTLTPGHAPAGRPDLTGQVRDGRGPVSGARVRIKGMAPFTLTDAHGSFHLPRPARPASVTAWKDGYLIGGTSTRKRPLRITLSRVPADDNETYAWVASAPDPARPGNCANCHPAIYREWAASAHARSANGRHFRNLYEGTDWRGRPGHGWNLLAERPEDSAVCTACHAPTVTLFLDPAYTDLRQARGVDASGVHCDYCHKIAAVDNQHFGLTHGRFGLKLLRPSQGQLFFGPLDDVDRREDAFAPVYRDSRYCASCHEGTVLGVAVYTTYSEWQASPAARQGVQCQGCHMAPTGRLRNIAPGHGGILRDPRTLGNHRFFDGSQEAMLRRCLSLSPTVTRTANGVHVEVEVRADGVGHRVPTGFVDHNLVLVVEGLDRAGQPVVARRGPQLPAAAFRSTSPIRGRLYARLLKDFDGRSPVPFWRAAPDASDTRLKPGRPDHSAYEFPPTVERVRFRLLYRRTWPDVAREKGWPDNETAVLHQTVEVPRLVP